jgi:excinuclease ABC subunit C
MWVQMSARIENLLARARELPKTPGVYLMKDEKGRVIYIGKSASLRDRVSSYFLPSTKLEFKKQGLLDEVIEFDILHADSEVEALLIENRLIKDVQPKYNARLLDDKTFPYLMVTMGDDYPGVFVTRVPHDKNAKLFGPFTSVAQLREAVTLMQRAFKYRTCHLEILESDEKRKFFRPCLLHAINQCTAPCADKISREAYRADINRFLRFVEGDQKQILREMQRDMTTAAERLDFETAAKLRDEIKALRSLGNRAEKGDEHYWQPEAFVADPQEGVEALQKALGLEAPPRVVEGFDIAHLQGSEMVGSLVCFIDGVPFKNGYKRFKIRHGQGNNDYLSLQEVVTRRYREAGIGGELFPEVILIDGGLGQLNAALDAFKLMDVRPPMVVSLAKQEELIFVQGRSEPLKLPRNNTGLKLLQYVRDEAHRFAQHYHHILRRKQQIADDIASGRRAPKRRLKQVRTQDSTKQNPSESTGSDPSDST